MDVSTWVEQLIERLEVVRDVARERLMKAVESRKNIYDKNACEREFKKGDMVRTRILGLDHKLQEAWTGQLEVLEKPNDVNYRVKCVEGKGKMKVIHVNNLK